MNHVLPACLLARLPARPPARRSAHRAWSSTPLRVVFLANFDWKNS